MRQIRFENVGRISGNDYLDKEKIQSICDEGYRLVTIVGEVSAFRRYGEPVYGVFEPVERCAAEPVAPEVKPPVAKVSPDDMRIPTKRKSFVEKVRAQMDADAKGEKKE